MRHGAVRVVVSNVEEFLLGFFVPEGVQQGDSAGEGLLHRCGAGDGEVDGSELGLGEVFVVVVVFVVIVVIVSGGEGGQSEQAGEDEQPGDAFHVRPHECWRDSSHCAEGGSNMTGEGY